MKALRIYLRQRRRPLMDAVCESTNEKKYRVNKLTRPPDRAMRPTRPPLASPAIPLPTLPVAAYITTLVMNYLFTGKFKRTK